MNKQSILTTGLNGLVGSKFRDNFAHKYDFDSMDLSNENNPVDITNKEQVFSFFKASTADFVIHLAAFTDVTKAWEQKDDKNGIAYKVNVTGTQNIIEACKKYNKHLIHISTAYVFDGEKTESYIEDDKINPIEWYGQTKAWAEELVQNSDINWTILRIDQPFRSDKFPKMDTAHRIINGIQNNKLYPQFSNHYFGPTFIDDFAKVLDWVIRTKTTGLFNASSGESYSDYEFAELIASGLKENSSSNNADNKEANQIFEVKKGNLEEYLKTLDRPYQKNTAMNCEKLKNVLDFDLMTIQEAIKKTLLEL